MNVALIDSVTGRRLDPFERKARADMGRRLDELERELAEHNQPKSPEEVVILARTLIATCEARDWPEALTHALYTWSTGMPYPKAKGKRNRDITMPTSKP